ncbi:MAG: transposase, partial [Bacteroidota bacterium]|nr:transposase [Bacteroidota bacterium]
MRHQLLFLSIAGSSLFTACTNSQAENETVEAPVATEERIAIPAFPERTVQLGDPAEADQRRTTYVTLQQKLNANPNDLKSWIKLSELFITEARITGNFGSTYVAALSILDDLLDRTKTSSAFHDEIRGEALTLKALIMLSQHQFKEALVLGEDAIKLDPYRAFNYGVLVDAHVELGNYPAAVQMSDRMVSIRPDLRSYSRVSYIREIHGDITGAIAAMDMAVKAG